MFAAWIRKQILLIFLQPFRCERLIIKKNTKRKNKNTKEYKNDKWKKHKENETTENGRKEIEKDAKS